MTVMLSQGTVGARNSQNRVSRKIKLKTLNTVPAIAQKMSLDTDLKPPPLISRQKWCR